MRQQVNIKPLVLFFFIVNGKFFNIRIKKSPDMVILSMQNSPRSFKHSKVAFCEVFTLKRICIF